MELNNLQCKICGTDINSGDTCENCRQNLNQVQVLTPEEREDFQGITINDNPHENHTEENEKTV